MYPGGINQPQAQQSHALVGTTTTVPSRTAHRIGPDYRMFAWLRSFLPQGELPVKLRRSGELTDALMADTAASATSNAKKLHFPKSFLLGSATAAYQVEGGLDNCNWAEWERSGKNGEHFAGKACDMWNLFEEDVARMQDLGLRMYRFSVEWSRIEPVEGQFDEKAIERYVSWCKMLSAAGIEPMITLHHFTEPIWFDKKGGWEKRANVEAFIKFVEFATARLAPHCQHWCTINELNGYAVCGWLAGVHPPGKVDDFWTMLDVIRSLLVAHARASKAIRAASAGQPNSPIICLALSHIVFVPQSLYRSIPNPLSLFLATLLNYLFNFIYIDGLLYGRLMLPFDLLAWLLGWREDVRACKDTIDVLGVNHYYRSLVSFGVDSASAPKPERPSPTDLFIRLPCRLLLRARAIDGFEKNDMGWDLTPSSMERLLRTLWNRYHVPIIVTESGIADGDDPDDRRTRYLAACFGVAHRLRAEGVDLRGYLLWTLLDNFEWAEGFRPRFGLLHTGAICREGVEY
jgi:beta-glucosidase